MPWTPARSRFMSRPAGRRLTRRILPIAERYEAVALEGFTAGEAEVLRKALRRLYDKSKNWNAEVPRHSLDRAHPARS